jgi:hypothetical protein
MCYNKVLKTKIGSGISWPLFFAWALSTHTISSLSSARLHTSHSISILRRSDKAVIMWTAYSCSFSWSSRGLVNCLLPRISLLIHSISHLDVASALKYSCQDSSTGFLDEVHLNVQEELFQERNGRLPTASIVNME